MDASITASNCPALKHQTLSHPQFTGPQAGNSSSSALLGFGLRRALAVVEYDVDERVTHDQSQWLRRELRRRYATMLRGSLKRCTGLTLQLPDGARP